MKMDEIMIKIKKSYKMGFFKLLHEAYNAIDMTQKTRNQSWKLDLIEWIYCKGSMGRGI